MSTINQRHLGERALVETVLRDARKRYGRRALCATEFRSHGRARTDLVVLSSEQLIAVEAKLYHWRRAILQALLNTYFADLSYVALWSDRVTDQIIAEAARFGIGVLSVDRSAVSIVNAAAPLTPNVKLRGRVVDALRATLTT